MHIKELGNVNGRMKEVTEAFTQNFGSCSTSTFTATDKPPPPPNIPPTPPSLVDLLHQGNNIKWPVGPRPSWSLFVHRFVYYSLCGKAFRNVKEVGVSSRSLPLMRRGRREQGTGRTGEDGGGWGRETAHGVVMKSEDLMYLSASRT